MDKTLSTLLLLFFAFAPRNASCQSTLYSSKWQFKLPAIGINLPLSNLLEGAPTDHLIYTKNKTYLIQPISVSYFFRKHWGLESGIQVLSVRIPPHDDHFINAIAREYEEQYYLLDPYNFNTSNTPAIKGFLNLIYRKEWQKLYVHSKLSIGITSIETSDKYIYLKERNANNLIKLTYSSERRTYDHFTIGTPIEIGYKIKPRFAGFVEISPSWYKGRIVFEKTLSDRLTEESITTEESNYRKNIYSLSVGAGVVIMINKKRK